MLPDVDEELGCDGDRVNSLRGKDVTLPLVFLLY
jgi:hypothetical protein